jgi:hypothetical protein
MVGMDVCYKKVFDIIWIDAIFTDGIEYAIHLKPDSGIYQYMPAGILDQVDLTIERVRHAESVTAAANDMNTFRNFHDSSPL